MINVDKLISYEDGSMSEEEEIAFIQELIDNDTIWHLQGHYQRTADKFVEVGLCHWKIPDALPCPR